MKVTSVLLLFLCISLPSSSQEIYPKREMRAVWVATVRNIDWPSREGLSVEEQKKGMTDLLDLHQRNRMNAIIFQVRPACDALYNSSIEPWAKWLTGTHGMAPKPYYDPLEFAIKECRKRSMELHAWFNPYRAVTGDEDFKLDSQHVAIQHPEWILTYGENRYLDPGLPQVRNYVTSVIADVVSRYDIDAVHMDDYFYPYKIQGEVFPDDSTFVTHSRGFSPEQKDDWRRDNVNLVIKQLHDTITSLKPWVQFGISPFGVWRNKDKDPAGSDTRAGQTNYDDLYADVLKWLREGWIDYVVPQVYWHIGFEVADHKIISEWWNDNSYGKSLYIGNGVYRMSRRSDTRIWRSNREIVRQLELSRSLSNVSGNFYFSSKVFAGNPARLNQVIRKKIYPYPALIPENRLSERIPPDPPINIETYQNGRVLKIRWMIDVINAAKVKYFVVYRFQEDEEITLDNPENIYDITSDSVVTLSERRRLNKKEYSFVVTAANRFHYESETSDVLKIRY